MREVHYPARKVPYVSEGAIMVNHIRAMASPREQLGAYRDLILHDQDKQAFSNFLNQYENPHGLRIDVINNEGFMGKATDPEEAALITAEMCIDFLQFREILKQRSSLPQQFIFGLTHPSMARAARLIGATACETSEENPITGEKLQLIYLPVNTFLQPETERRLNLAISAAQGQLSYFGINFVRTDTSDNAST